MFYRLLGVLGIASLIIGMGYLNNKQAKELATQSAQLTTYSGLVEELIKESELYILGIEARDETSRQYLELIRELQDEQNTLRNDLRDGRKRVLVKATCPTTSGGKTDSSSPATYNDGLPELDPSAGDLYLDFRSAYIREHTAFRDLQEHVRQHCNQRVKL